PYTTLFRSAGEGARIEEAPAASLDDPERDQRHAGDEQDEAGQIGQLTRRFVARLAEQFVAADHGGDADRDVDVEDPPPAPGLDDEATRATGRSPPPAHRPLPRGPPRSHGAPPGRRGARARAKKARGARRRRPGARGPRST